MGSDRYCLRWNNHQNNLLGVFSQLLQEESLVDVTLACSEGHSIRAHKVVLSACSSYFQSLFIDHPSRHPIIILKDVCFAELRTLVEFMYRGEVNLEYCQLPTFLKTAESLQVKGLAEMTHLRSSLSPDRDMDTVVPPQPPPQPHDDVPVSVITPTPNIVNAHEPLPLIRRRSRSPPQMCDLSERIASVEQPLTPPSNQQLSPATANASSPPPTAFGLSSSISRSPSSRMPLSVSPHPADTSSVCDDQRSMSPDPDDDISSIQSGPSDMTVNSQLPSPCLKIIPGPSNFPPVQQVPLSLKKESNNSDWDKSEERSSSGNNGSDYSISRHLQDSDRERELERQAVYVCTYCGATFPHQSKLTRHILSHSLETLKYRESSHQLAFPPHGQPAITTESSAGILDSATVMENEWNSLRRTSLVELPHNVQSMDHNESAGAVCKFCGKAFPDVSSLIGHLPAHTGERPFKCEFCGKAFKLRHHMKDHCRVHTGERPFRCSLCGKTFSRSTILKAHEKTHYPKCVRKFLSSPSPEDEQRPSDLAIPCDLSMSENSVEASTSAPPMFMHRPTPSPSP